MSELSAKYFSRLREHIRQVLSILEELPPEEAAPVLAEIRRMEVILSQYDKASEQRHNE